MFAKITAVAALFAGAFATDIIVDLQACESTTAVETNANLCTLCAQEIAGVLQGGPSPLPLVVEYCNRLRAAGLIQIVGIDDPTTDGPVPPVPQGGFVETTISAGNITQAAFENQQGEEVDLSTSGQFNVSSNGTFSTAGQANFEGNVNGQVFPANGTAVAAGQVFSGGSLTQPLPDGGAENASVVAFDQTVVGDGDVGVDNDDEEPTASADIDVSSDVTNNETGNTASSSGGITATCTGQNCDQSGIVTSNSKLTVAP